jgi:hypothetical protein
MQVETVAAVLLAASWALSLIACFQAGRNYERLKFRAWVSGLIENLTGGLKNAITGTNTSDDSSGCGG